MRRLIIALYILFALSATGQQETSTWYFGRYAGLSFATGKPEKLLDSKLTTEEGASVISDAKGRLLFYTNGVTVWNADHLVMRNGMKLGGDPSSTQSSVVIAQPGKPGRYFLFTTPASGKEPGLCYSVVDMSLGGGKGDVVAESRNTVLSSPVTEKLTAVMHRNGRDVWLIAHAWKSDEFLAYLVTGEGVQTRPVSSKTGSMHGGATYDAQGYMKASPDGTSLALALEVSDVVEVLDFNNETGSVSNPLTIKARKGSYVYGIEFSPDGSLLYFSAGGLGEIWQVNLQAGSGEGVLASPVLVGKTNQGQWIGALQLASDGKIYFSIHESGFLGVIEKPDLAGAACGYRNNAVSLGPRVAALGLPNFAQSYFTQSITSSLTYFDPKNVRMDQGLILKGVNFDFAKYALRPSSSASLDQVVQVLKQHPDWKITVAGHTDNTGNKSSNIVLSHNRAQAVKDYLVQKGISAGRISCAGYGSRQPVASNSTDAGRAQNRRVEILVVSH